MQNPLEEKCVVVTGTSSGIGKQRLNYLQKRDVTTVFSVSHSSSTIVYLDNE